MTIFAPKSSNACYRARVVIPRMTTYSLAGNDFTSGGEDAGCKSLAVLEDGVRYGRVGVELRDGRGTVAATAATAIFQ